MWGHGQIMAQNQLNLNDFELRIGGAGKIDLPIQAKRLSLNLSGAVNGKLKGAVENLDIGAAGSSRINAEKLIAQKADVRVSGAGEIRLNVIEYLEAITTGSGAIIYSGSPKVNSRTTGAGRVHQKK